MTMTSDRDNDSQDGMGFSGIKSLVSNPEKSVRETRKGPYVQQPVNANGNKKFESGNELPQRPNDKANFLSETVWTGDCLDVMRGMNSDCVDLIYLDPPFNNVINDVFGSNSDAGHFKDNIAISDNDFEEHKIVLEREPAVYHAITAARYNHGEVMMAYLIYMGLRLMEMRRVLTPRGTIYFHCDSSASHYVKMLMDGIFGKAQFRNEIIWCYRGPFGTKRDFPRRHDSILRYVAGNEWTFNFNDVKVPYKFMDSRRTIENHSKNNTLEDKGKLPESWWADILHAGHAERTGYPTQKPLKLLDRIIKASSNEGDLVFDPFCGCATTLVAADRNRRLWIGCDLSPLAVNLVNQRIKNERKVWGGAINPDNLPQRSDQDSIS